MENKNFDFENSINELEKIIKILENGECSLEESIELFEQGMKHTLNCKTALSKAEKRIISLTELEKENLQND